MAGLMHKVIPIPSLVFSPLLLPCLATLMPARLSYAIVHHGCSLLLYCEPLTYRVGAYHGISHHGISRNIMEYLIKKMPCTN
jgi:hypothetical protein